MPKKVAEEFEDFAPKTKAKPAVAQDVAKVGDDLEGRCMKCQQQRPFIVVEFKEMKGGTRMAKGKCGICGTTVCKILGKGK